MVHVEQERGFCNLTNQDEDIAIPLSRSIDPLSASVTISDVPIIKERWRYNGDMGEVGESCKPH